MRWTPCRASEPSVGVWGRWRADEDGSEVVSHVLVQGLVLLVVLAVLQLGFALHTRNLAIAAAGEGARRGGLVGGSETEAVERTGEVLDALVGVERPRSISTSRSNGPTGPVLTVSVTTSVPVVGRWGPTWLTVRGSSLIEEEP